MTERIPGLHDEALVALAQAWNRLDPELVAPWLDEAVSYDSRDTELSLQGRGPVLEYLVRKFGRIEEAGEAARIRAELGWVRGGTGGPRACIISSQGEVKHAALFLVTLTEAGLIERIEVTTSDPDPRFAEGSGFVP